MLKMRIPPEAVRQKMKRDKVSDKIIAALVGPEEGGSKEREKESTGVPKLSAQEEDIAKSYRKMLKVSIPKEAVKHKMIKDNVSNKIMASVLGESESRITGAHTTPKPNPKSNRRSLVGLHWTPLSPKSVKESVWGRKSLAKDASAEPEHSDIMKLEELFQKKKPVTIKRDGAASSSKNGGSDGKEEMARLIDLNRANNIAISLKAFKDFSSFEILVKTIGDLDPNRKIEGERVQFLSSILPTEVEARAIQSYKGSDNTLVPAEKFFRHLNSVSRVKEKVATMQTMNTFDESTKGMVTNFQLLGSVCNQVMNSTKLAQVLETVLNIGNIMNEGTRSGGAAGFKLESLLKLTQTKSSDGKLTVLDYIVMTYIAKDQRNILECGSEFPDSQVASRMPITEMVSDVRSMQSSLNKCETELENMKLDQYKSKNPTKKAKPKLKKVPESGGDPKASLLAAIRSRSTDEDDSGSARNGLLAAIRSRSTDEEDEEDKSEGSNEENASNADTDPRSALLAAIRSKSTNTLSTTSSAKSAGSNKSYDKNMKFSPGVERLEQFMKDANSTMKILENQRDSTVETCKVNLDVFI